MKTLDCSSNPVEGIEINTTRACVCWREYSSSAGCSQAVVERTHGGDRAEAGGLQGEGLGDGGSSLSNCSGGSGKINLSRNGGDSGNLTSVFGSVHPWHDWEGRVDHATFREDSSECSSSSRTDGRGRGEGSGGSDNWPDREFGGVANGKRSTRSDIAKDTNNKAERQSDNNSTEVHVEWY